MKKNYFKVEIVLPRVKLSRFTVKMISEKYIDRVDLSKIPCKSYWQHK